LIDEKGTATLNIEGASLLFAYRTLFPLIEIISKWSGTSATYKGAAVYPYRFIFGIWNTVAVCSAKMNETGSPNHCHKSPSEKGWGCKHVNIIKRHLYGTGDYEKGHPFWYNYGSFSKNGDWIIDKNAIFDKLKAQISSQGYDVCPFFSMAKIRNEVFNELPDKIIIDHVTFRAHFEVRYDKGERVITPVNIRHVYDPVESYRRREKKLINGLASSMFYAVNELEVPGTIKEHNQILSAKLELLKDTDRVVCAFENGVCKN